MKNLLLIIDYQNDFVTGSLGFEAAALLEPRIVEKIEQYLERGDDIAFTLDTHHENYLATQEGRNLPVLHCISGTEGHLLYGEVARYLDRGKSFLKPTFGSETLFKHLLGGSYEKIELVGLVSNICVLSNAVICKTALPEAEIVVDAMCTASFDSALHEKALDVLEGLQVKITGRMR